MTIPSVFRTSVNLPFLPEDLQRYPWLSQKTRVYLIDPILLGSGVYSAAHRAYAADNNDIPWPGAPTLIMKVPIFDPDDHHIHHETQERLADMERKAYREIRHIRKRLSGYASANAVMDLGPMALGDFHPTATIQLFVPDAEVLDEWLVTAGHRDKPAVRVDRRLTGDWKGITNRPAWVSTALRVARSLHGLHKRRVTHSDIHPGNIMLSMSDAPATLIDLADAFVATPASNWRTRKNNPYLAPERIAVRSHLNERVDIYAFGILLLYLATGQERQITTENYPGRLRSHVYSWISVRNPSLLTAEPRIVDLIAKSIARDPVDRPRMADICEDLESIAGLRDHSLRPPEIVTGVVSEAMEMLVRHSDVRNSVLVRLLQKQIFEIAEAIKDIETEMSNFREQENSY